MIALIQRVSESNVMVDGVVRGEIGPGLLVLLAVQPEDKPATVTRMAERVRGYRVVADAEDRIDSDEADEHIRQVIDHPWIGHPQIDVECIFHKRRKHSAQIVTTRQHEGGTGLGLAIVRAVAEAHGGSVEVLAAGPPNVEFCLTLVAAGRTGKLD